MNHKTLMRASLGSQTQPPLRSPRAARSSPFAYLEIEVEIVCAMTSVHVATILAAVKKLISTSSTAGGNQGTRTSGLSRSLQKNLKSYQEWMNKDAINCRNLRSRVLHCKDTYKLGSDDYADHSRSMNLSGTHSTYLEFVPCHGIFGIPTFMYPRVKYPRIFCTPRAKYPKDIRYPVGKKRTPIERLALTIKGAFFTCTKKNMAKKSVPCWFLNTLQWRTTL